MVALPSGTCRATSEIDDPARPDMAPWIELAFAACGEPVSVCGKTIACDCATKVEVESCPAPAGAAVPRAVPGCQFTVASPRYGECFIGGAVTGGDGGSTDFFAVVPLGEVRSICGEQIQCSCAP
jgi:hypothetical protein